MSGTANLKETAVKGLIWSAIERIGAQGIQFIFGIIITRILFPADYGLVGMILIFVAIGQTIVDSGFGSALIWKNDLSETDLSTVFYFNITVSLILYFILFFLAPFIAVFYDEPRLINLIRVICLNFLIISFSLIQQVDLQKRVDFKLLAVVNIFGSIIAGIIALIMAFRGLGAWALVMQILVKSFVTSLLLWIFNKWRPVFVFSLSALKQLFSYGSNLLAAGLLYTVFRNLYFNIIGKLFPVTSLGYYTRAVQLHDFPVTTIGQIFNRVVFPVFSTIKDSDERLKNAIRKTLRTMVFITFPVLIGLIAVADELIEVVLTEKWLPASGYFKLFCLAGLFYPFQVLNNEVLKTKGKSNLVLRLEIITKIVLIINILITWRWGITVIIIGQMLSIFLACAIGFFYVFKLIGYTLWEHLRDIFPYLAVSTCMYFALSVISIQINKPLISLIVMSFSGFVFYCVTVWFLKLDEIKEIQVIVKMITLKNPIIK
ncbi:MAG: lipopolysaccharide biosynthesis protein [Bacteroidales bacterium]|jgi:O-antigen/teichoic acid export membrane protein|nr:lipopolysaccharide biosynthesis protein [Bacteroidales bacterium]